jgi:riboflavin synthase
MFTGIVRDTGTVENRRLDDDGATFSIRTSLEVDDFEIGESIAVDGVCLTVTATEDDDIFEVDLSPETLDRTTLGEHDEGDPVHLERALRVGDRLGGHFVQGHVDGVGRVAEMRRDGDAWLLEIDVPDAWAPYLIEKGSIAVDGVSLTINGVEEGRFSVAIIPHTDDVTRVGSYDVGDEVNIEVDMLGKYVEQFVVEE